MSRTAIDLTRTHHTQRHGDITAHLTWWLAEDSGPRPCLVLTPTDEKASNYVPCIVHIDSAWKWSEEIGDPVHAGHVAVEFAEQLGQPENVRSAFRVRGIIIDHLQNLLTMPTMPKHMRTETVLGEAKVTERESGKVVRHEEYIGNV